MGERVIELLPGETVLEGLEREGLDVPSGCRAGICCKCMLQADNPPTESQRGLRSTLRAEGYFLACTARPDGLLRLGSVEAPEPVRATVVASEELASDVRRILLRPDTPFPYRAGQYLEVAHTSGAVRNYSIASLPSSPELELHVRRIPGGRVSPWLCELDVGATVSVRGAFGQCFYVPDDRERKLLLVGTGTGLAPLLGIVRDALRSGHTGRIDLVHGGLTPDRLYLRDELEELASAAPQLSVHACVLRDGTAREHEGALEEVAVRLGGRLRETRAFLSGDPGIVRVLQRGLFMAGVASSEILADPFETHAA